MASLTIEQLEGFLRRLREIEIQVVDLLFIGPSARRITASIAGHGGEGR
jgi:hypothetical protein